MRTVCPNQTFSFWRKSCVKFSHNYVHNRVGRVTLAALLKRYTLVFTCSWRHHTCMTSRTRDTGVCWACAFRRHYSRALRYVRSRGQWCTWLCDNCVNFDDRRNGAIHLSTTVLDVGRRAALSLNTELYRPTTGFGIERRLRGIYYTRYSSCKHVWPIFHSGAGIVSILTDFPRRCQTYSRA